MAFNKKNNTFVLAENILIKYAQYLEKTTTIEIPRVNYETPPDFPIHIQRYNEEQQQQQQEVEIELEQIQEEEPIEQYTQKHEEK